MRLCIPAAIWPGEAGFAEYPETVKRVIAVIAAVIGGLLGN